MITLQLNSNEDIKSFRLTCKKTNQALATEALRRITVNVNKETFENELCKLRYLAEGCLLIPVIRQVDIKSLSPDQDPHIEWPVLNTKGGAASEEEELRKYLYNALSSLKNVRTVRCVFHELFLDTIFTKFIDRWTPGPQDGEWAQIAAVDAIKTFHNLQCLHIELQHCRIEIPFHSFTALRHISVHDVGDERNTFKNLVKMISQSPLLESFDFSSINFDYRTLTRSLHHLFESSPDDENGSIPPLRLKHLSLARCLVRLDDEAVMRHLRHLTSLSLDDLVYPRPPYSDDFVDDSVSEDESQWGSDDEQIWRIICNTDLRLEEITLCRAPLAFLEYIGSYSGLRKLKISTGAFQDEVASDYAAKKFYEALERHASSIEELDVIAFCPGLWCFGHHNKALFSTFQNLTTLRVWVQTMAASQDIGWVQSVDASQDIVSSFGSARVGLTDVKIESPDGYRSNIHAMAPGIICIHCSTTGRHVPE